VICCNELFIKNNIKIMLMKSEVKSLLLKLHSRIVAKENEGNEFLNQMLTSMASVPGF
jgi:hypothetical protein